MIKDRKTLLILNPVAGKGGGKKRFDSTCSVFEKRIQNLKIEISKYPGHVYSIIRNALKEGYKRFISIGGDGTSFEIINGIFEHGVIDPEIELGMLPAGTGNSFLRDFTEISYEKILDLIFMGKSRDVDVIEFSYFENKDQVKKYCLNLLGAGLISDILKLTNERLKFLGSFGYSLGVLIRLFKGVHNRIILKVNGEKIELKNSAMVISNSKFTGGKMKIAPMAQTDDGKVDVIVFNDVGRKDIIQIFSKVFKGKHIDHKKVRVFTGSEIELYSEPQLLLMADGELLGKTPLKLRVLPQKLKILI